MRVLEFDQIVNGTFGEDRQLAEERIDKITKLLNVDGVDCVHGEIRKFVRNESYEHRTQYKICFWVRKHTRKIKWDDIMGLVNSVYAPKYTFLSEKNFNMDFFDNLMSRQAKPETKAKADMEENKMDYLADLYSDMDLDFSKVETEQATENGGATYMFVVENWNGQGYAHYHTFDKQPTKEELIAFAEQYVDDEGHFVGVEVSRMVETDDNEHWEMFMRLSNRQGKLQADW